MFIIHALVRSPAPQQVPSGSEPQGRRQGSERSRAAIGGIRMNPSGQAFFFDPEGKNLGDMKRLVLR